MKAKLRIETEEIEHLFFKIRNLLSTSSPHVFYFIFLNFETRIKHEGTAIFLYIYEQRRMKIQRGKGPNSENQNPRILVPSSRLTCSS